MDKLYVTIISRYKNGGNQKTRTTQRTKSIRRSPLAVLFQVLNAFTSILALKHLISSHSTAKVNPIEIFYVFPPLLPLLDLSSHSRAQFCFHSSTSHTSQHLHLQQEFLLQVYFTTTTWMINFHFYYFFYEFQPFSFHCLFLHRSLFDFSKSELIEIEFRPLNC